MSDAISIVEVGPRDGLQNEARAIPVSDKVALIDALSRAGFARIEAASFVSAKWVPQMAGSGEVMERIARVPGVSYGTLTPNMRGLKDAMAARADWVAVFASASEGFSKANLNATIDESLARFADVAAAASDQSIPVRGYVSCIAQCPYDGPTPPTSVARVATALFDMGCHEVSLGDTLGRATPTEIVEVMSAMKDVADAKQLAGHFHNTSGGALANVGVAINHGVRVFDASIGGLGGCPYAPGAAGNLSTMALVEWLDGEGLSHGLDRTALTVAEDIASKWHKAEG